GPEGRPAFSSDADWPTIDGDNGLPVAFRPGALLEMENPEYRLTAHVDRWGGRSLGFEPDAGGRPIPFLGDSQTFGVGVADDRTFVSQLARRLGRRFLNLGIPGSALDDQIRLIANRHDTLERP